MSSSSASSSFMKQVSNVAAEFYISNSTNKQRGNSYNLRNGNNNKLDENNGTQQQRNNDAKKEDEFDAVSSEYLGCIAFVRFLAVIFWAGGIFYATCHVYWTTEEQLPFQREPDMNPGFLSEFLGRGRDSSDYEWVSFSPLLWTKYILACAIYQLLKMVCSWHKDLIEITPCISPLLSVLLFCNMIGVLPSFHLIGIPVMYWLTMKFRQKWAIWGLTVVLIFYISSPLIYVIFPVTREGELSLYFFVITSAWSFSRGVSFCMDMWDRPDSEKFSIQSLLKFQQYVFYLPLLPCGPLVTFEHFEREVILKTSTSKKTKDLHTLGKSLLKLMITSLLVELIYHVLYFRALSVTIPLIKHLNIWTLCGAVYWLGQIFALKYKVLYGIPSCIAEFDGLSMYPVVSCPAYIHRYSVLWKDFDRGLYVFLVKYIYAPLVQTLNRLDAEKKLHNDLKKLMASFVTFIYIFIWHSTSFDVFVWTAFNFLGITIEKIGSLIKRKIDNNVKKLNPITWDFIIEPLVTIPIAGMSILNSSVFCAQYDSAEAFYKKLSSTWTADYNYHVVICCFLYCFTHVGVAVRTWTPFSKAVMNRLGNTRQKTN